MKERESFGSRLGFILVSAGCAIGLGNVWKFPYMCGKNGGAFFILIYLIFLAIMGFPIMVCEFAVGRGSKRSCATAFKVLEKPGSRWHNFGYFGMAGNYLLMMFYTTVAGWMMYYCYRSAIGEFSGKALTVDQISEKFGNMLASPGTMAFWTILTIVLSFGICSLGLQNGVEKITKVIMICLLGLIIVLAINSVRLPNAAEGIKFYLIPNMEKVKQIGIWNVIFDALSQSLFTLSIGMGSMAIFGSYLGKERSLSGETITITSLDTFVALMSGLIIIPACFSFGIEPDAGPKLIFITLPNVFQQMAGGRVWGTLFFLFMSFAALTTVTAVFENIISCAIDLWGWSRKKSVIVNIVALCVLSLPCILGYNILSSIQPLGVGSTLMDMEDFLVSNNLMPLGSLVFLAFCVLKKGWGWDNFIKEANTGNGMGFPQIMRNYIKFGLPVLIIVIYLKGYWDLFAPRGTVYLVAWMIVAFLLLALIGWFIFGKTKNIEKK